LKHFILLFFVFVTSINAAAKDPNVIIKNLQKKFEEVKDYEADVKVKIDMDMLKAPESKAKIYFKQPDKVKIKSESFSLLPKQGINFLPGLFIKKDFTAVYVREDNWNGLKLSVIKIIPLNENSDISISTLWVDESKNVVKKAEVSTKSEGTFSIDMSYAYADKYYMVSAMKFSFDLNKLNAGKSMNDATPTEPKNKRKFKRPTKGTVYINYSDYKINKGIPDSFFKTDKK